jgi:hypothetical protein
MSETEQAEAVWQIAMAMPDVAAMIAEDARENLGGTEVVSVGSRDTWRPVLPGRRHRA